MIQKQTKLEDFKAFQLIVESYGKIMEKFAKFIEKCKTESKPQKQTVFGAISKNKNKKE